MLRASHVLMAALFALAAAVQWNDLDPVRWMAIYGAACVSSMMAAGRRPPPRAVAVVLAGIALAWAAAIGVSVGAGDNYLHMFDAWEMNTPAIEAAREATGLLLVGGWMLVIAAAGDPVRRRG